MSASVVVNVLQSPSESDLSHVQNSKLLTKLLFLVDSGSRDIRLVELPGGALGGILDFESYRGPHVDVLRYKVDTELGDAAQFKVWVRDKSELVFHASEVVEGREPTSPVFLWRQERPHGRLFSSNTYWSDGVRLPPVTESAYELHLYTKGAWEDEVTGIAKGMLRPGSRLFDVQYRSKKILELTPKQLAALNRYN